MLLQVKETITRRCAERSANKIDEWADAVSYRLSCINDLPAEEAIYHRRCYQYFMSPRNLKLNAPYGALPKKRGRPSGAVDEEKKSAFKHVIEYLENNDDETVTLDELQEVMENEAGGGDVYSKRSLQRQLYAHYGSRVSITSSKQQQRIVTLSSNVKQLIQEAHTQLNDDSTDMNSLIKVVGSYIRNEIKSAEKHRDMYPDTADMIIISPFCLLLCACFYRQSSKVKLQICDVHLSAKPS